MVAHFLFFSAYINFDMFRKGKISAFVLFFCQNSAIVRVGFCPTKRADKKRKSGRRQAERQDGQSSR
jgi:hypothetical protein